MAGDLDPKHLGRSKDEEGRFTLTPAERKLSRQTREAGEKLGRELPERDAPELPGPNENPFEREPKGPQSANYAKGGQVGRVGGFGLKRSKPDFAGGGGMQNFKNYSKKGGT